MIETSTFREAMSRLGAAVNVVTTDGALGRHGFTASAVCSVTAEPPTLLVCINRSVSSYEAFIRHGVVGINVLAGGHQELSGRFSDRSIDMEARFAGHDWVRAANGAPLLTGAAAALACSIASSFDVGTHSVLICPIQEIRLGEGIPGALMWVGRAYHSLPLQPAA